MSESKYLPNALTDGRVVYLGNLSYETKEDTFVALAAPFDSAARVEILTDPTSGRSRGFGFIRFATREAAARFIAAHQEISPAGQPTSRVDLLNVFDLAPSFLAAGRKVEGKLVDYFARHPEEMRTMDARLFEELVAQIWQRLGYQVELTAKPGDGGVDIVAIRNAEVDVCYLVQCKRPRPGKSLSVVPVRELLGVVADRGATKGIIATTVSFTSPARALLGRHHWRLEGRDYDGLVDWLARTSASNLLVGGLNVQTPMCTSEEGSIQKPRPPLMIDGRPITVNLARPRAPRRYLSSDETPYSTHRRRFGSPKAE